MQAVPVNDENYASILNAPPGFPFSDLAKDVDIITLWAEYFGIPYDEFAMSEEPPPDHPWTIAMSTLAQRAHEAGKPIMLELGFVRTGMVAKATEKNGLIHLDSKWAPVCYDFSKPEAKSLRTSYPNYARWMAKVFKPKYLVIHIEMNLYYEDCGGNTPSWKALVDIEKTAYDAVKGYDPEILVFPSFSLERIYGNTVSGWDQDAYEALYNLKRDRFGIATYPSGLKTVDDRFITPYNMVPDYLFRVQMKAPEEKPIVITETGWISDSITLGTPNQCFEKFLYSEEVFTRDYLSFLLSSASIGRIELVNWWSVRDFIPAHVMAQCYPEASPPFVECGTDPWCKVINTGRYARPEDWDPIFVELVYKAFGTMGLRTAEGAEKPKVYQVWSKAMSLPVKSAINGLKVDLNLRSRKLPKRIYPGEWITHKLVVRNRGPKTARHVTIIEMLPKDFHVNLNAAENCALYMQTMLLCDIGTLRPRKRAVVRIKTIASQSRSFVITAKVNSDNLDSNPRNNVINMPFTVLRTPGLQ